MLRAGPETHAPGAQATTGAPATGNSAIGDEPMRGRGTVFAVVGLALLLGSIDQTAVATALPTLQHELGAPLSWTSWTITIYSLGAIIAMPVAGRLADQFGRKSVFLASIGLFTVASLVAGLAGDIATLIVVRVFQGLAAGALVPSATGIVAEQFGRNRDRAIGMFTSIFPIGAIIGPVVGGVLVTFTSWRAIFLVNIPIGVVVFVLVAFRIRQRPTTSRAPVDVTGIALLSTLLLATMTAITMLGTDTAPALRYGTAGGAALVAAVLAWRFLRHARRDPLAVVPMRLLRGRTFGTMNAVNVMFGIAALGFGTLVPLYAEARYGIVPLAAGLLLAVRAVGMIATSGLAVSLLRRVGSRGLMVVGFVLLALGLVLLAVPPPGVDPQVWLSIAAGVTGLGMGVAAPATNNATMHLAPDEISSITGLRGMFRQIGAIVSISTITAVLTSSVDPGAAQAIAFAVLAAVLLAALPLILSMPDHRGSW
ncbi:MFS transporter [Pseudonocardia sp. GCM10023141]|uniref:MFS transporter n=1 Tax=Pseudonocardia sp. GCM10023141 TaxID=3252653 RepID=UPI003613CF37